MLQLVYAVSVFPQPRRQPADRSPLQPQAAHNGTSFVQHEALSSELKRRAVAARQAAKAVVLRRSEFKCAEQTEVAVIIASDIRLDPNQHTRPAQIERINQFTAGSSLFIHTDYAFDDDVKTYFKQAVAVRYAEEEDGGIPDEFKAGKGKTAGRNIQWWRLSRAWDLLSDYENECKHSHSFVMKMRVDSAFNENPRSLSDLYQSVIKPTFGSDEKVAFASSDRFFAGPHEAFKQMAQFGDKWRTTYKDDLGFCGTCDDFARTLVHLDTTPKASEIALDTDLLASLRKDCVTVEQPPLCATSCQPTATTSQADRACPLHASDMDAIGRGEVILYTHSFGHGGTVVDLTPDELATARQNATGSACLIRGPTRPGGSELMFAFHIFFSGLSPRSIVRLDESIWSLHHHNLVTWRHPLRLWSDGFTVDDGPLNSYEEPTNANFAADLHTSAPACISPAKLEAMMLRASATKEYAVSFRGADTDEYDDMASDECGYTVELRVDQPHERAVLGHSQELQQFWKPSGSSSS